jgi:UDP:flavonoid glycosyltransferase YjiC (YdhE family)
MKVGFLSQPLPGHLSPKTGLARKLASRGHEVAFIGIPDIEPVVRAADLDFVPFCENEFPPGSVAKRRGAVANLQGLDVVRYAALELTPPPVTAALEPLPPKIAETGVNALVIDSVYRLEIAPVTQSGAASFESIIWAVSCLIVILGVVHAAHSEQPLLWLAVWPAPVVVASTIFTFFRHGFHFEDGALVLGRQRD